MATSDDLAIEADLRALVGEFRTQEKCDEKLALHIITRVGHALGLSDVASLLEKLATIEAATVAAPGEFAGEGVRRARILRALYDCFVVSLTPAGHAACMTILASTANLNPSSRGPGH